MGLLEMLNVTKLTDKAITKAMTNVVKVLIRNKKVILRLRINLKEKKKCSNNCFWAISLSHSLTVGPPLRRRSDLMKIKKKKKKRNQSKEKIKAKSSNPMM